MSQSKAAEFKKDIKYFKQSEKNKDDLFALCVVAAMATRQGSGLCWAQVEVIINEVYEGDEDG